MLEMPALHDNTKTDDTNEENDHCIIANIKDNNHVNIIVKMDDIKNISVKMNGSRTNIQQFVYMHLICMSKTI